MPPKPPVTSSSHLNSLLLAILIGVASFIAAQVWVMNGRLVAVEVKVDSVQNTQRELGSDVSKIKETQSRQRVF